jgi:hypothetical protein
MRTNDRACAFGATAVECRNGRQCRGVQGGRVCCFRQAHNLGAKVLLLEEAPEGQHGGNTRVCAEAAAIASSVERGRGRAISGRRSESEAPYGADHGLSRRASGIGGGPTEERRHRQRPDVAPGEQGKGGKDRYVMLSPRLLAMLRRYWRAEKPCHWLFPGHNQSRSLNPSVLQGACRAARAVPASINPITRTPRSRVRSFGRAAGTNEFAAATSFHHEIVYGVRIFPAARSPCRLGSRTGRMGTD